MAVLVEGISVIVRRGVLDARYPGGWEGFIRGAPNRTLCTDGELARVGFMVPDDVGEFVWRLVRLGLRFLVNGKATDFVVVDQLRGPTTPSPWVEFGHGSLEDGRVVAGCSIVGSGKQELITPDGWRYETSLTASFRFTPTGSADAPKFLERRGGVDVYVDPATGKEEFVGRTVPGKPWTSDEAPIAERLASLLEYVRERDRVCPMPSPWDRLWKMLPRGPTRDGRAAPPPLRLAAWSVTSASEKMKRLAEQIRYARDNDMFDVVDDYLRQLAESEWHHEESQPTA